jgi:mono/diheme cytochrome c family protein
VAFLPLGRVERASTRSEPSWRFPFNTPEGRGERLFRDASIGGEGNAVSCASCHSTADERFGISVDGQIRPDRTVYGSGRRPLLWQGMAPSPGKAASICAKWFMLRPEGLGSLRENDLAAYLARLSPDPTPPLDYRTLVLTRRSELPDPLGGDPKRGKVLEQKFCGGCHGEHEIRSPLTPGLYEPDDLVRRIRWLPGTDARQMPPIYVDRLPDSDLRDIVTYLTGDESQRIFKRRSHPRPPESADRGSPPGPAARAASR